MYEMYSGRCVSNSELRKNVGTLTFDLLLDDDDYEWPERRLLECGQCVLRPCYYKPAYAESAMFYS